MPDTYQHMAYQPHAAVLAVGFELKRRHQGTDIPDNCICGFIFNQAAVHRHNIVTVRLIGAGDYAAVPAVPEGCRHFAAIVHRILHGNDRSDMAVRFQK